MFDGRVLSLDFLGRDGSNLKRGASLPVAFTQGRGSSAFWD